MFNETKFKKHEENYTKTHHNQISQKLWERVLYVARGKKTHLHREEWKSKNDSRILVGNNADKETVEQNL